MHEEATVLLSPPIEKGHLISESWNAYRKKFIQSDGRVVDLSSGQITTSEGQSYALLRAVWMDDRDTFDKVISWTLNNLKQKDTSLFAWKWGKKEDGSWGIMDNASATDGDQDIAFALVLAYNKWDITRYRELAINIMKDIWSHETFEIKGKRYIVAGDWVKWKKEIITNPSYLAPYAYRIFATADTSHDWKKIVDTSYDIIYRCSKSSKAYLPPDWCRLNRKGEVVLPDISDKNGDTSYSAFRVYWRLALDYAWFKEERAVTYINKNSFLVNYWRIKERIESSYTRDGIPRLDSESLSIYGMFLPSLVVADSKSAEDLYNKKILSSYSNGFWGNPQAYYVQNWVWFGIVLYFEMKEGKK